MVRIRVMVRVRSRVFGELKFSEMERNPSIDDGTINIFLSIVIIILILINYFIDVWQCFDCCLLLAVVCSAAPWVRSEPDKS